MSIKSIRRKIISYDPGTVFLASDVSTDSIGRTRNQLKKLCRRGIIRCAHPMGLYDKPKYSSFLHLTMLPDVGNSIHTIARLKGWQIDLTKCHKDYLLGKHNQVPGRYVWMSSGPDCLYKIGNTPIEFIHDDQLVVI